VTTRHLCRYVAYVRRHQIESYLKAEWIMIDDLGDTTHGEWSVIMGWPHEREMVIPAKPSTTEPVET
jgi:hypothetical protein